MSILRILREQIQNFGIIYRVAHYENKASYQGHYLGYFWQFLNPLIQIAIYYLVFSVGFKSASLEFILIGIIPWFFISNVILQGANSIFNQIHMASKMRFPLSTLPSITIVSNLSSFFVMFFVLLVLLAIKNGVSVYWLEMIYYFVAMVLFLYAFSIFNAIISIIIRDYYLVLQSLLRVLFYTTGVVWNLSDLLPGWAVQIFKLNPLMYIISGFRNALFYEEPLWSDSTYTLYFWLVTGLVLFLGTMFYEKFKNRLLDFM